MKSSSPNRVYSFAQKLGFAGRLKRTNRWKGRSFRMEYLENRQVMAGDITGQVFDDANANGVNDPEENGIPGWTVFVDTNGNARQDAGEPFAVTDSKGEFGIFGLPAGSTSVYEIPQSPYAPTPGFTDHQTVTVRDGRDVRVKFPNLATPVSTGQIVGTVYEDANQNGLFDLPADDGLEGWTVFVDSNNNTVFDVGEPITHTDVAGNYLLAGVTTGNATVYEIPQSGLVPIVGGLFPTTGATDHKTVVVTTGVAVRADFGNAAVSIGDILGNVWNDVNGDGVKAATDIGMPGVNVFIDLNTNGSLDVGEPSRLTDASGAYSFNGIRSGNYRVIEVLPATYIAAEGKPASVIASVFTGGTAVVDYFNLVPTTGSVHGVLWDDANGNGLQDTAEGRLAGWTVYVDINRNGSLDASDIQAVTTSVGGYTLAGVAYGTNVIREVIPSNYVSTNPSTGSQSIKLLNGENKVGVNFGNRERVGTIQGTVWNDANGDSIKGATESALAGWSVFLDIDSDGLPGATEPIATTNASGVYVFNKVPVGSYVVTEVVQSGWINSIDKPKATMVAVTLGNTQTADFFNLIPVSGSVSGVVWSDTDQNGIQGPTEPTMSGWQVYVDLNKNAVLDAGEPSSVTDITGAYTVTGVAYGSNVIREVLQSGFVSTNYPGGATTLTILNGENRTGVSFGNHEPADYAVSGTVFYDANRNGTLDAGERGLSGITLYIDSNNNGSLDIGEPTTVTSSDLFFTPAVNEVGTYSFTRLVRGNYQIREVVPAELNATADSNRTASVSIGPANATGINFANIYRSNEIHGVVFDDTDDDGVYDSNEYARPGVGVYIDRNRNDILDPDEPTTTTGDDGSYAFVGLTPGAYVVREYSGLAGPHTYPNTTGGVLLPPGVSNPAQGNVTPGIINATLADGQVHTQTVSLTLPGSGGITNMVDVFLLFDDTGSFTFNSPIVRAAFPTIISNLQAALPSLNFGFGVGRFEEYGSFAAEYPQGRPFTLNQPIVASSTTGFSTSIQAALDRMAPGYGGDQPETDIEALYQVVTGLGFDGNNNGSVLDSGPAGLALTQVAPGNSGDVPSFASFRADPANNVLPADGSIGGAGFRPGALPVILTATDTGFAYQPKGETSITGTGGLTLPISALTNTSRGTTPFASGAGIQETVTGLNALGALVIGLGTNPDPNIAPRQGLESLAKLTGAVNNTTATIPNGTLDPIAPGDPFYFQISSGFGSTVASGITSAIQNAVTNVALDITVRASDPRVRLVNHTGTIAGVGAGQTASFDIEFVGDGRPHRFDLQFVRAGTNVVVGSIPVVIGTPIAGDYYSYDELEDGEIHHSSHFGNYVVNQAPSFIAGGDVNVQEDTGSQSFAWATGISPGGATESRQTVQFLVSNSNNSLFSVQPSISSDGTLTFTPAPNAFGTAVISVQAQDNGGKGRSGVDTSPIQTFVVNVASVADAPVAVGDSYSIDQDSSLTVAASGVLVNDSDADGDALTSSLATPPAHGTVTLNADGSFVYTPTAGYFGTDSFTYTALDAGLLSSTATVTINIAKLNHAPVAGSETYTTNQNIPLNVLAPGLLANDLDSDADPLTAVLVSGPANGTLVLNPDGSFTYTPALMYAGPDSFTYRASDGALQSADTVVNISVLATNTAPVANDDSYTTAEDSPLDITAPGVMVNDIDAEGNTLTATVVTGPAHGTLTLNANGSFRYTPVANFNGPDSFTYQVSDGGLTSNIANVAINVTSVNDAPIVVNDTYSTSEDITLTISAPGVIGNDTDADGDAITATLVTGPTKGTLTFNASGAFTYVPNGNVNGPDSFTYRVSDGTATSLIATVALNVIAVNDPPVARNESYATNEDTALSVAAPGLLANDTDIEGSPLTAAVVTAPAHGTVTISANGAFVYRPAANYNGPDSFTYRSSDGGTTSNIATVAITVNAVNDAPSANADSYSTLQNLAINTPAPGVLTNDVDVDGDALTVQLSTAPSNGTLTLNANGSFSYVPNLDFVGSDSFTYVAKDATSQSSPVTVSITVLPPGPKFFVIDGTSKGTFKYGSDGAYMASHLLARGDSKPRGIASDPLGTTQWVADASGTIYVYNSTGTLLGSWVATGAGKPEGIAVWGNDLWVVDPVGDRVHFFAGGATRRSGRVGATSSFALNSGNLNSTDIVTDGVHLWVLNNTTTTDKVFRYLVNGTLEGSWTLSATSPTPTGITLDPTNVNHLWVVDSSIDRILQYDGATSRLTGSQEPSLSYVLNAANGDAQGIADPLSFASLPIESKLPNGVPAVTPAIGQSSSGLGLYCQSVDSILSELDSANARNHADGEGDDAPMVVPNSNIAFAKSEVERGTRMTNLAGAVPAVKSQRDRVIDAAFAELESELDF